MTEPTCTCHPVPEQYHTTHYGATEPGSTLEPDFDCAVHFPKVKREWGKAPARIYADRMTWFWTWECRIDACTTVAPREADAWHTTQAGALEALAKHQHAEHVDAIFRGDRGGPLGMAMDRTSERSGA